MAFEVRRFVALLTIDCGMSGSPLRPMGRDASGRAGTVFCGFYGAMWSDVDSPRRGQEARRRSLSTLSPSPVYEPSISARGARRSSCLCAGLHVLRSSPRGACACGQAASSLSLDNTDTSASSVGPGMHTSLASCWNVSLSVPQSSRPDFGWLGTLPLARSCGGKSFPTGSQPVVPAISTFRRHVILLATLTFLQPQRPHGSLRPTFEAHAPLRAA